MACDSDDVDALTGKLITIGVGQEFTTDQVDARIRKIVTSKVFPAFQKAGYSVPWTYPLAEFSTFPPAADADVAAAQNNGITEMIAKGTACDLCKNLPRFNTSAEAMGYVIYSRHPTVKGWCKEFHDWLEEIASGEITFSGIAQSATPSATVLYSDTTPLFKKFDDGDGTESDQDDW